MLALVVLLYCRRRKSDTAKLPPSVISSFVHSITDKLRSPTGMVRVPAPNEKHRPFTQIEEQYGGNISFDYRETFAMPKLASQSRRSFRKSLTRQKSLGVNPLGLNPTVGVSTPKDFGSSSGPQQQSGPVLYANSLHPFRTDTDVGGIPPVPPIYSMFVTARLSDRPLGTRDTSTAQRSR